MGDIFGAAQSCEKISLNIKSNHAQLTKSLINFVKNTEIDTSVASSIPFKSTLQLYMVRKTRNTETFYNITFNDL